MKSHKVSKLLFQILCHLLLLSSAGSLQKYDKSFILLGVVWLQCTDGPLPSEKKYNKKFLLVFFWEGRGLLYTGQSSCKSLHFHVKLYNS